MLSGDELDRAVFLWLCGKGTDIIARDLRVREATVYRSLEAIRAAVLIMREKGTAHARI